VGSQVKAIFGQAQSSLNWPPSPNLKVIN
jgi:hypothetical protein